jgi:hypothetical protein
MVALVLLLLSMLPALPADAAPKEQAGAAPQPKFTQAAAFDVSRPLREIAAAPQALRSIDAAAAAAPGADVEPIDIRPDRGPEVADTGYGGDGALQSTTGSPALRAANAVGATSASVAAAAIQPPLISFEGVRNTDNPFLVAPPDPVGDVGPNHYVEMVNLVYAVFDKAGNRLVGPTPIGALWEDFPIADCADLSGDPIVLYDQLEDRWLLSQFTAAGPEYWSCVAISQTGDPTGAYYRYAFSAGPFFPDYPKYGVWTNSYLLTTRDFGPTVEYGISVYALEKNKMLAGNPNARAVQFFLDGNDPTILPLVGDGLLPADIDGTRRPKDHVPAPIVGTQDNGFPYGAAFDALNIFDLRVQWRNTPEASLTLAAQLPVAEFDSVFPCAPTSRDCIPQPGVTERTRWLDILSYRQRPTWRLAYRNFGSYEAMVTNQSVEALPGLAGVRWYEIRRTDPRKPGDGTYSLAQQGTFTLNDGVHRWMGSAAQDRQGNIALGYSVSNGSNVFPGIRYTGRLAADPPGQMTLGEGTIIDGTGVQLTTGSRWGDYTSLNVDPTDDCTFWYVNQYIQTTSLAFWQTHIGAFRLPGCTP